MSHPYREASPREDYEIRVGDYVRLLFGYAPGDVARVVEPARVIRGGWYVSLGCPCCPLPVMVDVDMVRLPCMSATKEE